MRRTAHAVIGLLSLVVLRPSGAQTVDPDAPDFIVDGGSRNNTNCVSGLLPQR